MRTIIIFLCCLCLLSKLTSQEISFQDINYLIELGIEDEKIVSYLNQSENKVTVTSEEIEILKKRGVSSQIIDALSEDKLQAKDIVNMLTSGASTESIVQKITNTDIAPYGVSDWLLLRNNNVPKEIVSALQSKWSIAVERDTEAVTLEDIQGWHRQGMSGQDIVSKLGESSINMKTINTMGLLELKKQNFPVEVIRFLAEKHLNPENKKTADINNKNASKEEKKDITPQIYEPPIEENKEKISSPKIPEAYIKLYTGSESVDLPKIEDENIKASVKRYFYTSMFSCPGTMEQVELFYKKHYQSTQVTRIYYNNVVGVLKIKFAIPGVDEFVEVRYYTIDKTKLSRLKNLDEIKENIVDNDYKILSLTKEMERKKYLFEIKNISEEQLNKELREIQNNINVITNTKTYWDYVAIKHIFAEDKNMLLLIQPTSVYVKMQEETELVEKISKVKIEPHKVDTLAKDFPLVVFPQTRLISHEKIEEALKRTSKLRSIYRSLFLCEKSTDEIEQYYRKYYPAASIWSLNYNGFKIVRAKFEIPEIRSEVEVAFYTLTIGSSSTSWEARHERIKEKLEQQERIVKNIDNEINSIQELLEQKKMSSSNALLRIQKLERQKYQTLTTQTYLDYMVMDKVMTAQKSILVVAETKRHY